MILSEWERIGVDDVEAWARKYANGSRAYDIYPRRIGQWEFTARVEGIGAATTTFGPAATVEEAQGIADDIFQQLMTEVPLEVEEKTIELNIEVKGEEQ